MLDREGDTHVSHFELAVEWTDARVPGIVQVRFGKTATRACPACIRYRNRRDDSRSARGALRTACATRPRLAIELDDRTLGLKSRHASRTARALRADSAALERRTNRRHWTSHFKSSVDS